MKLKVLSFGLLFASVCMAEGVGIGPENGFAGIKSVSNAKMERTKDSLVFTDIKFDVMLNCRIPPIDTARVTGFEFRYRVSGKTERPKAGGEVFYSPLSMGGHMTDDRKWRIPPLVRDGKWHVIRLPLSSIVNLADWRSCGMMADFRFDPTNAEGGRLEISYFRFLFGEGKAKKAATDEKFAGEDAWPELVPETFKTLLVKQKALEGVEVECRGGTAVPRVQDAGGKVKLRFDYRGPLPNVETLPASVSLMTVDGTLKWNEELSIPFKRCLRHVADDVWALEFDYELPRYIGDGNVNVHFTTPHLLPTSGHASRALLKIRRIKTDPDWPDELRSKVADVNGSPCFAVNGKPVYPLWGTIARGRRNMTVRHSSAPLNFVTVWTNHREWWPKGEEFDPVSLDLLAERHRRDYPEAYFIWDISIYPPPDWAKANPDHMALDEQGRVNTYRGGRYANYSFASKKVYEDMERVLAKVIRHLESSPYANRIAGYRINSGHTVEWLAWDPVHKETILDFSPVAQKGFEAFARKHYPWITDYSVPTLAERRALDADGFLWDQRRHARAIAFHDFYSTAVADGAIRMCRAAKNLLGGRKLVGTYFGYVMTLNGGGASHMRAHYATKRFLDAQAVDFLMSPQDYSTSSRQPGTQVSDMKPFASLQKHGIVSVIEDDTRTHNITKAKLSQTVNEEMTVNIMRRNMGAYLCRNQPFYTYAITSGREFDFPRFADDAAALAVAGGHAVKHGVRRAAQIAVVVSEEAIKSTPMYHGSDCSECYGGWKSQMYDLNGKVIRHESRGGRKNSHFPYSHFYTEAARIGAGVDLLLAEDVADNPGDYRLYIFQICTKLTPSLVKAAELLRKRDCTILWTYAPGYTSNDGNSTDNMKTLTGMEFTRCDEVFSPGVTLEDGTEAGHLFYPGNRAPLRPIFAAVKPDKVLGRYRNGAAGLAMSRTGMARTIFSGSYFMRGPLLQKIAKEAGVHVFCDSLDIFEANERFLSVHARNAGVKKIRLPRRTTVIDVFNRRLVAKDTDTFEIDAPLHSSWLFYFADDAEALLEDL